MLGFRAASAGNAQSTAAIPPTATAPHPAPLHPTPRNESLDHYYIINGNWSV